MHLIRSASVLLLLWCVYSLLQLAWLLLAPKPARLLLENNTVVSTTTGSPKVSSRLTDLELEQLGQYALFGATAAEVTSEESKITLQSVSDEELNAKKTRLDLKLLGLVYSPDQSQTLAIIAYKNRQDQYRVGGELPVTGRVELARVFHNRVVIANNGHYESLWLYDEEQKGSPIAKRVIRRKTEPKVQVVKSTKPSVEISAAERASEIAQSYRQQLYRDPASLADAIQISPVSHNGEMIGYRVAPGRNPQEFAQMGLKPNDIVTSVNNIQLNGPVNAYRLYQLMKDANEANVRVKRGDQNVELMLSLDGGNS